MELYPAEYSSSTFLLSPLSARDGVSVLEFPVWLKPSPWIDSLEHDANAIIGAMMMNNMLFQFFIMAANIEKKPIFVKCADQSRHADDVTYGTLFCI